MSRNRCRSSLLLLLFAFTLACSFSVLLVSAAPIAHALQRRGPAPPHPSPPPKSSSTVHPSAFIASPSSSSSHGSSSLSAATSSSHFSTSSSVLPTSFSTSADDSALSSPATPTSTSGAPIQQNAQLPLPAIGAIAGIGGVAFIAISYFLTMRYVKKKDAKKSMPNSSAPFPPLGGVQTSVNVAAASPFPSNTPYERLDDPKPIGTFIVTSTYTPTLGDELDIQPGDKVTILVEYDDGWVQGINESRGRQKGVFPKHCVDCGQTYDEKQSPTGGDKRMKRISSMYGGTY